MSKTAENINVNPKGFIMESSEQKILPEDILAKILNSYVHYYMIKKDGVPAPFSAFAEFHSHNEQFVLVKKAKIADNDSNEYVYFLLTEYLDVPVLTDAARKAWEDGLAKVKPSFTHRNSDVTLVAVANTFADGLEKAAKKIRFSKSYSFSFRGWSNFRLVCYEAQSKKFASNYHGKDLIKTFKRNGL